MPMMKHKVFACITHAQRLLVFRQPHAPEAGVQVPAGTLRPDESPEQGVMREALEETGLTDLRLEAFLGQCDFAVSSLDQVHRRRFYHLSCGSRPPATWRHVEKDPDGQHGRQFVFEFFWVPLSGPMPPLAPGHDRMLHRLRERLVAASGQDGTNHRQPGETA